MAFRIPFFGRKPSELVRVRLLTYRVVLIDGRALSQEKGDVIEISVAELPQLLQLGHVGLLPGERYPAPTAEV